MGSLTDKQRAIATEYYHLCDRYARHAVARGQGRLEYTDFLGEAHLGLVSAAASWDPEKGSSFESWAWRKIRGRFANLYRRSSHIAANEVPTDPLGTEEEPSIFELTPSEWPNPEDAAIESELRRKVEDFRGGLSRRETVALRSLTERPNGHGRTLIERKVLAKAHSAA